MTTAARELVVAIPLRVDNPLNGSHQHWATKARKRKHQRLTTSLVMAGHLKVHGVRAPCGVLLTRYGPSNGLDGDGLQASLKAVRDGLADALGVNDRSPFVTWDYDQRREKTWGVEIRIAGRPTNGS